MVKFIRTKPEELTFRSSTGDGYSSFSLVREVAHPQHEGDVLFVGSDSGHVYYFFPKMLHPKQELLGLPGDKHSNAVLTLLHTTHPRVCLNAPHGLLFSGSRDRSIKVWNINAPVSKCLYQTLLGHTGAITSLNDAGDGTIFSCSVDGTIKNWAPQRNRDSLCENPFLNASHP